MAEAKNILLIHPTFAADWFMGHYDSVCRLVGTKQPSPPLGLMTIAAMLPSHWRVRLLDKNTETLSNSDIEAADLVMVGGMISQQRDMLQLIDRVHSLGKQIVLGGPDPTSSPHIYKAADFILVGEAEGVIDDLLAAWLRGDLGGRFEAKRFTADMTASPVPRFDLINTADYLQVSLQFSRGCPFTCEFCDVIELYGRVPRLKTPNQAIVELQALYDHGYRGVIYVVDDNLIGNKKAIRSLLPHICEWQKAHRYPFQFHTAVSLNVGDDLDLLQDLRRANFFSVFIGIESADTDVLNMMKKKQNTKHDMVRRLDNIHAAGLTVTAGFVIGFDNEGDHLVPSMINLIETGAISICMFALLCALPDTQLTRRLRLEGRMFDDPGAMFYEDGGGSCLAGLNFETKRPREQIVRDFATVLDRVYEPKAYFDRILRAARRMNVRSALGSSDLKAIGRDLRRWMVLTRNFHRVHPDLVALFWSTILKCLITRPRSLKSMMLMIAMYGHLRAFATRAVNEVDGKLAGAVRAAGPPPRTAAEPVAISAVG